MARDYQGKRASPHVGLTPKAIPLKLLLDMVPSSLAYVTCAFRVCFSGGVMFRFFSKQRKAFNGDVFDILITSKRA